MGRPLSESTDAFVESFTASNAFDHVLAPFDIEGSIAHATMLHEQSIISEAAFTQIREESTQHPADIQSQDSLSGLLVSKMSTDIESALIDRIGDVAKVLHAARSATTKSQPTFDFISAKQLTTFSSKSRTRSDSPP